MIETKLTTAAVFAWWYSAAALATAWAPAARRALLSHRVWIWEQVQSAAAVAFRGMRTGNAPDEYRPVEGDVEDCLRIAQLGTERLAQAVQAARIDVGRAAGPLPAITADRVGAPLASTIDDLLAVAEPILRAVVDHGDTAFGSVRELRAALGGKVASHASGPDGPLWESTADAIRSFAELPSTGTIGLAPLAAQRLDVDPWRRSCDA